MNKILLAFAILALAANGDKYTSAFGGLDKKTLETNVWVVFAAGSKGYSNYRHQADICHGYQVAHGLGIPDERIIMFMYDDIAYSASNPNKGQIFNDDSDSAPDVYAGVPHDYTGSQATANNFLKILSGEDMTGIGSGKTLKSTTNDHVFVFFDDHGGSDILCFPDGRYVHSAELQATLETMHTKGLYGKFVFYVEACYSGSMFYKISIPENMYIATAAPIDASSYAFKYSRKAGTYVADVFSWLWINDVENFKATETLQEQFAYMKSQMTSYSLPCQYGDLSIASAYTMDSWWKPSVLGANATKASELDLTDMVPAWMVPLESARRRYMEAPTEANRLALEKEKKIINVVDEMVSEIFSKAATRPFIENAATGSCGYTNEDDSVSTCIKTLSHEFANKCGTDPFYLRSVDKYFISACRSYAIDVPAALKAIDQQCAAFPFKDY